MTAHQFEFHDTTRVTVQIGKDRVTYVVAATTAPIAYDGFGTLTLADLDTPFANDPRTLRLILVREEHLQWQMHRYSSGLEGWATAAGRYDYFDPEHIEIEPLLWKRLTGEA